MKRLIFLFSMLICFSVANANPITTISHKVTAQPLPVFMQCDLEYNQIAESNPIAITTQYSMNDVPVVQTYCFENGYAEHFITSIDICAFGLKSEHLNIAKPFSQPLNYCLGVCYMDNLNKTKQAYANSNLRCWLKQKHGNYAG